MRTAVAGVLAAAGLAACLPVANASAALNGQLTQLPSPLDCIQEHNSRPADCGTLTGHGLGGARAVAVSPDGHNVYVVSQGIFSSEFSVGYVAEFQRNSDGSVSQLAAPNNCVRSVQPEASGAECPTKIAGFGDSPVSIVVSPDGQNVYVIEQNNSEVVEFTRDPTTGALSPIPGHPCVAEHPPPGQTPNLPSCDNTARGLSRPTQLVVSPDGRNVYVAGSSSNAIAEFARSPTDGSLTELPLVNACIAQSGTECPGNNAAAGLTNPLSIAISPDGHSVYSGSGGFPPAIAEFSRSPVDGSLTQPQAPDACVSQQGSGTTTNSGLTNQCTNTTAQGISNPQAIVVSPDNKNLYLASNGDAVAEFSRNQLTGAIAQLVSPNECFEQNGGSVCTTATGTGLGSPGSLAISPNGGNLYVGSSDTTGAIATLTRSASDGSLTQPPSPADCIEEHGGTSCGTTTGTGLFNQVGGVAISPDGANLYSAAALDSSNGALAAFARFQLPATITVREASAPTSDSGRFDLKIDSAVVKAGAGNGDSGQAQRPFGSYTVSEAASAGTALSDYTTTISCTKNGAADASSTGPSVTVTVAPSDVEGCTITNTRKATGPAPGNAPIPPPPGPRGGVLHAKLGQSILLTPISGLVYIKLPGSQFFRLLRHPELVPPQTLVDVRYGEVEVTTASDLQGDTQSAFFGSGAFSIVQLVGNQATASKRQTAIQQLLRPRQVTVLTLIGPVRCPQPSEEAHGARARSPVRSLWGSGHGSFSTKGHYSAATVRGTQWLTVDECDATVTTVTRGVVAVRDYLKHRTVLVSAGHAYRAVAR